MILGGGGAKSTCLFLNKKFRNDLRQLIDIPTSSTKLCIHMRGTFFESQPVPYG